MRRTYTGASVPVCVYGYVFSVNTHTHTHAREGVLRIASQPYREWTAGADTKTEGEGEAEAEAETENAGNGGTGDSEIGKEKLMAHITNHCIQVCTSARPSLTRLLIFYPSTLPPSQLPAY